ncbi:MAG: glycosyltransferase, partial [Rhodobacteraceae bacterium]|nr:glycosyltransferase [Paracoccaceae bacterium]
AEKRARRSASEAGALRRARDSLESYGRALEARHQALLDAATWRAMEPARRLIRLIRRRPPARAFVPRLSGTKAGSAARSSGLVSRALELEAKLWGGFSARALADLEALKADPAAGKATLSETAWVLARWQAAQHDPERAYENIVAMRTADPAKRLVTRCVLLESDCLMRLGRSAEARALLAEALARAPGDPHLRLAMANAHLPAAGAEDGAAEDGAAEDGAAEAARLGWINRIYADAGFVPLARHDPARALGIDNLGVDNLGVDSLGAAAATAVSGGPRISVIMPAFRAARTLPFALRGLLAQSWADLEILVVDDCSPDDTVAVAEAVAARDPRVKVLRQAANQGGYAARNAGLRAATGDLITTHDADDWSHPQKLEAQARWMAENPAAVGCFSDWVRCGPDLRFGWLNRAWGGFIAKNMSSIMLRRAAFDALGGWDDVRVGADTDLLRRAERRFGTTAIGRAAPNAPLAFALLDEGSLTRASATHVRTTLYGSRREYEEAGAYWRAKAAPEDLRFPPDRASDPARAARPFPAPPSLLGAAHPKLDLLFISDFCLRGGAFVSTHNYVEAARAAGRSVGLFHWRRYDLDAGAPLNPAVRALAQAGEVRIVSPGEAVRAETVIVGYPAILTHPVDLFPAIDSDNLVVVVNQMASRLHGGADPQYDPAAVRANLATLFGREGAWAPISGLVARLMRADPRYPAPSETIWIPLIDAATWCAAPLRWRGATGAAPVIGRHARDHYTKWPAAGPALRAAYCADRPCEVEIMGGAARALEVIGGKKPANWTVHRFGAMEALPFLQRLDFFVHYPLETYIEEFGRAVLEALAAGLPAILPPVFRESFGEAAVYAEPDAVWPCIAALWGDEAAYLAQAKRGRDFVLANSDWSCFAARLARTVAPDAAPAAAPAGLLPA